MAQKSKKNKKFASLYLQYDSFMFIKTQGNYSNETELGFTG